MKITFTTIDSFIKDFRLGNKEKLICFDALIQFRFGTHLKEISSEVFIENIGSSMDTVYFLNPELTEFELPYMFQNCGEVFSYTDDKCLLIIGNNLKLGDYIISIYPINKTCKPATVAELKAKKYN